MNKYNRKNGILVLVICVLTLLAMGMFLWPSAAATEQTNTDGGMTDTIPTNRFLSIDGLRNARQLGGYIGADGRAIKDDLLLRTERLDKLSDEAAAALAERYSIAHVVDFRMDYERVGADDHEIAGAANEWINVYQMDMTDPETIALMKRIKELKTDLEKSVAYAQTGKLASLYTEILLSEAGQQGYARFFQLLLETDGPVLWHCTYGKDRTGVAAALLMYALGVDEETIMEEFLLTNEVYQAEIAGLEVALKNAGYDDAVVGEAQAIVGVKGEYLTAAFDAVKEEYGSIEDYIRNQLGVSDEALHHLREKYLA